MKRSLEDIDDRFEHQADPLHLKLDSLSISQSNQMRRKLIIRIRWVRHHQASPNPNQHPSRSFNQDLKERLQKKGTHLWSRLVNATDGFGRTRALSLMSLPSEVELPGYYLAIKDPIDFNRIKTRLDHQEYTSHQDLIQDLRLVLKNAKRYHPRGTLIYRDATALLKMLDRSDGDSKDDRGSQEASTSDSSLIHDQSTLINSHTALEKPGPEVIRLQKKSRVRQASEMEMSELSSRIRNL